MLILDDGEAWTAITQPAHAHLAGQVARHWAGGLAPDVALAVEQHDVAWAELDLTPPLHPPQRRAASFIELDPDLRLGIWRHVTRRLEAQSPYAALLVSLHATNIHTRYVPAEHRPDAFLAQQRADQDAVLAVLPDVTRAGAERDADLVFGLDQLSLTLCLEWEARELTGTGVTVTPGPVGAATLDPWPLDVPELTVTLGARRLAERYDDEHAMQAALAAAPVHRRSWHLRPPG